MGMLGWSSCRAGRPAVGLVAALIGVTWLGPAFAPAAVDAAPSDALPADGSEIALADRPDTTAAEAPELLLWQEIPTVVSASRRAEPATRAPNAVSVITADQIHASGLMTLPELLRLAPGVDVGRIHGSSYAVGVRGLHNEYSKHTLVLMDGRTVYNPIWGGVQWFQVPVLVEDIERIEVVRGPGGAAWGANASSGVINIITRKPGETPGLFLSQTLTSRLDSLTYMRYGTSEGPLDFRVSAGYDSMPEIGVRHGDGNHDFSRLARANLRSTYHIDEQRSLDLDAGYLDGVQGGVPYDPALFGQTFEDANAFPQAEFFRVRYTQRQGPDESWYVQYFLNRGTNSLRLGGPWTRYVQHDLEAQQTRRLGDRHLLTWGGNLRLDAMTNGDPWVVNQSHTARFDSERSYNRQAGLFVQDRFEASDDWTVILGARADRNSWTGWEWSGRGTVLYHPADEHTFRASVARAFRTPSLLDRELDTRAGPTGLAPLVPAYVLLQQGSEDLNASYVRAYEFGYTYHKDPVHLNAEFFYNDYRGLMRFVTTRQATLLGTDFLTQQLQNDIDAQMYGFELSGTWDVTDRVRLDGYYVWNQTVQDDPGRRLAEMLANVPPRQKVGLGARWQPVDDLTVGGRMWWVSELDDITATDSVPPYARFDFNVTKRLGEHAEVTVGVQNAFDSRHPECQDVYGAVREVGERTWYVRFQADF